MPQYKGDLEYPPYEGPHELIEVVNPAGSNFFRCIVCDIEVDPSDLEAHRAQFEPEVTIQES